MDYCKRVDVSTLGTTYATTATCLFGNDTEPVDVTHQAAVNEGQGTAAIVAVSFDGTNDHAFLMVSGEGAKHQWLHHTRNRVWLRRLAAAGAGQFVHVMAWGS